jgi:GcrA cell cycle regulator
MSDQPIPEWMANGRLGKARRLWDQGLSATQIAAAVGHGATKSAIVGKAHRLRWPSRPSPIGRTADEVREATARVPDKPHHRPSRAGKPRRKPADPWGEKPDRLPVRPERLAVPTAVFSVCQWPQGERGDWRWCDAPAIEGKPYCPEHMARAFVGRSAVRDAWVSA